MMALVKPPAGDVEAIKARLEAHDQQRERFGYCDETAPQIWEADVRALIARVEELEAALERCSDMCRWRSSDHYATCEDNCKLGRAEECPANIPRIFRGES